MDYHKNEVAENVLSQLPRDHLFCLSCQIKEQKKGAFISAERKGHNVYYRTTAWHRFISVLASSKPLAHPANASLQLRSSEYSYRSRRGLRAWVKFTRWRGLWMRRPLTFWGGNGKKRGSHLLCPTEIFSFFRIFYRRMKKMRRLQLEVACAGIKMHWLGSFSCVHTRNHPLLNHAEEQS